MRIVFNCVLIFSVIALPLALTLLFMAFGALYFSRYIEAVAAAVFIELLYHGAEVGLFGAMGSFTLLVLMLVMAVEFLRFFIRLRTR